MLTAGVDLAAEPQGTALAVVDWGPSQAVVVDLQLGVTDEPIVNVASHVDKLGIDCAVGWPEQFVKFMVQQAEANLSQHNFDGGMKWRRTLAYRETDKQVRELTGRWPLSVSTDRLGLTAMRCAGLLSRLSEAGIPLDRAGTERIAEVYPGASLRLWGLHTSGYRTSEDIRRDLLRELKAQVAWFNPGDFEDLMVTSCDAFDAVIAAFAARAVARGQAVTPRKDQLSRAKTEGWICLPQGTLQSLID